MKRFCPIISCFLAITILISSSMVTAHAAAVTSPLIAPFWTWAGEKALGDATPDQGYLGVADYLDSVFSLKDSGCPSSQSKNGCHFWQLVEDLTVSVLAGKFRVKCSYCGMYYSDYSSCDPDGEAAAAYSDYVSTLPATGYSSAGALLWQPRWIEDAKTFKITLGPFVSSGTASYAISPEIDGYYQSVKACSVSTENTTILVEFTDPSSTSSPNFDCHDHVFKAPINGNYRIIASPYASGKVLESSTWRDYDLSWKPLNFGGIAAGGSLRLGKATPGNKDTGSGYYSYFYLPRGGTLAFYAPVFQIVPVDTSISNTTYNINTRVNNFNGDYYDSVTNNYYNNTTIVNETNNTYYDMSTNTTQNMTSWNYDYKSRTYFITLEDGTTVAVQFGDNELTITKNDETSNTYNYVIKNNSGSDTPDTPTTCKHNWVETVDTAPTCLEGGHASYTCSLCKETYEQVLPANGHTWTVKEHQATSKGPDIKLGNHHAYAAEVARLVKQGISVDIVVNRKKRQGQWTVSTSTLYRYVDRGYIPGLTNKHLPERPHRKQRRHNKPKATRAPKGLPIDRRPSDIDQRFSFGHWEFDSVIGKAKGKRQSILTLTERKTRFEIIIRTSAKTSAATVKALESTLSKFPAGTFKTITVDNGSEFQDCHGMEHDRHGNKRLTVYYAHPYSSWERGSNERNNRIIRRYLPKGKSLAKVTQKDCDKIAAAINAMPRKILDYYTAAELFEREIANLPSSPNVDL